MVSTYVWERACQSFRVLQIVVIQIQFSHQIARLLRNKIFRRVGQKCRSGKADPDACRTGGNKTTQPLPAPKSRSRCRQVCRDMLAMRLNRMVSASISIRTASSSGNISRVARACANRCSSSMSWSAMFIPQFFFTPRQNLCQRPFAPRDQAFDSLDRNFHDSRQFQGWATLRYASEQPPAAVVRVIGPAPPEAHHGVRHPASGRRHWLFRLQVLAHSPSESGRVLRRKSTQRFSVTR